MQQLALRVFFVYGVVLVTFGTSYGKDVPEMFPLDDYGMSAEDKELFMDFYKKYEKELLSHNSSTKCRPRRDERYVGSHCLPIPTGECLFKWFLNWLDLNPLSSDKINTKFYFSSRTKTSVEIKAGDKINLNAIDFDPKKKTVMIVHGFMSSGGAKWIKKMREAYLALEDVNVIVVDWSGGCNTLKYWRAAVSTKTVGEDIVKLIKEMQKKMKIDIKKFHLIGHSLGAHTVSFASQKLGKVGRITGLDPALPCFNISNLDEKLDNTDADFVDIIHTNGKQCAMVGFGVPHPMGHADFYANGGLRQPGCGSGVTNKPIKWIKQPLCSHGRSYEYYIDSLTEKSCDFVGIPWDLTVAGAEKIVDVALGKHNMASSQKMGVKASSKWKGSFFVVTKPEAPYCTTDWKRYKPSRDLLEDIRRYFTS